MELLFGNITLILGLVFGTKDVLQIHQGQIKGSVLKSRDGREFYAFQGIPYAKPPIGDLRFKEPVPAESWKGILNTNTQPNICIQKNLFMYQTLNEIIGDEDCLYLNVYTPRIPKFGDYRRLPVMVWIPGGGFSSGHGGSSLYGPQYLLDKEVVLVTINYRVGPLGFLSTEDDEMPGNYGMKDQVLALKWVQKNIPIFGGDPKRVTIFGESAGAVSVGLHLLSPMSKGLFHKAIIESGSPLCRWAVSPPGWAKRRALSMSTIAGCPTDSKQLADCLRKMPADLLVDLHYNFFEWTIYPAITFMPVVEQFNSKTEQFLSRYPLLDFNQESNVPVLIGMNSGEGGLFVARLYNGTGHLTESRLKKHFEHYVSSLLIYKYTTQMSDILKVGRKIFEHYFPDGNLDNTTQAVKMVTGGIFLQAIIDMAINMTSPVHFYVYDYTNEMTFNSLYGPCTKKIGVTHGDEMISLFPMKDQEPLKGDDLKVSKLLVDLWTRFASTEGLTIDGTDKGNKWPLFSIKNLEYLLINSSTPVLSKKPYMDEYKFWNELPLLSRLLESEIISKNLV
ncbi:Carboxylesterase type B, conserved site,Carboxylesterase, type B,Carboxylesterase type B [Cinara cedri]|uniref:Carboxylic ester hydrolase n=1 Tax=Cinara cedri TaxID=506608 RepID=A0A5E4NGB5_9HEMI|nr:Carboxylesterase type B, conserved site,Carboxylesterase, type B,Carboxylesterase type B [Cinara cedri]